jgi:hypothetical protein
MTEGEQFSSQGKSDGCCQIAMFGLSKLVNRAYNP